MAGWAYTIRGQMTPYPQGGDADKMQACQGLSPGEIGVWSGNGEGICYFGELIALGMKERGCVGALIDGGIRDVRWIGEHQFPVFARYKTSVQSIGRWKVNACQVPVYMRGHDGGNVIVRPGDFILADEDGAIVIPVEHVHTVLVEAERLTEIEKNIRKEIANGLTLAEALKKYGHV
jgi:regulator of RNase E activity RraA